MDRRFSMRAYRRSSPRHWARLSPGGKTTRGVVPGARTHLTPGQGVLGRGAGAGTFGSLAGHAPHAGVLNGPQDPADEEDGAGYSVVRSTQPTVGVARNIATFLRVAVSLTLALPMARFYTRSLYWDRSLAGLRATGGQSQDAVLPADRTGRGTQDPYLAPLGPRERPWTKVRLSRQSLRDLAYWCSLKRGEGRDLHPLPADLTMHSDPADLGYGGTLGPCSQAGSPGLWEGRRL
jgi:hypothetical protein